MKLSIYSGLFTYFAVLALNLFNQSNGKLVVDPYFGPVPITLCVIFVVFLLKSGLNFSDALLGRRGRDSKRKSTGKNKKYSVSDIQKSKMQSYD